MSAAGRAKKVWDSLKGLIVAVVIVLAFIGALWLYAGVWPPLVVVESNSMQHSDTRSYIGVIDTGDLVILKQVGSSSEVRPYLESYPSGYSTYSELGDVIVYRPLGSDTRTPIIHRAVCRVEYNSTGGGFDVPALRSIPADMWTVKGDARTWYDIRGTLVLYDMGFNQVEVRINFTTMLSNFAATHIAPHGGFITLGDNNRGVVDQSSIGGVCWRPVQDDWINGVARGEIPWFGLIKLYVNGQASQVPIPSNSQTNLLISLGLIIGVPIAIDITTLVLERRGVDVWGRVRQALHLPPKKEEEPEEKAVEEKPKGGKKASSSQKKGGSQQGKGSGSKKKGKR
ncbi:MAG: S26 family signal peptidase [Methanomassiliicoccales archaeon]|nr:S26 family signal peptidase [Methanomassiliicoccales archaeon]